MTANQTLSNNAQQVAEALAIIFPAAPARTHVLKWLNTARRAVLDKKSLTTHDMSAAIKELTDEGIADPPIEASRGVTARGPRARRGHISRLCESALDRGTYQIILRLYENSLFRPSYYERDNYIHNSALEQQARYALISNTYDNFPEENVPPSHWLWLTEPAAEKFLQRLPQPTRHYVCIHGMAYHVHFLLPFDVFAKTCRKHSPAYQIESIIARGHIYRGEFAQARSIVENLEKMPDIAKLDELECSALKGLMACLEGDDQSAMQHIENTLSIERSGTRKRIIYPDTFSFGMSLFSLIRLATTESIALYNTLMEARNKLNIESDLEWPLLAAASAVMPSTPYSYQIENGPVCLTSVLYAIASRWHKDYRYPDNHPGIITKLDIIGTAALSGGYRWVAAEIQTVMHANVSSIAKRKALIPQRWQDPTAEKRHETIGTISLTKLVTAIEQWEFSLRELEQLALKSRPVNNKKNKGSSSQSKRLTWRIHPIYDNEVSVTPIEQTLNKSGQWSGGRRVALKRLKEQAGGIEHLTAQDVKASSTIQKFSHGWHNSNISYETEPRTVFALIGHPCIFDENDERYDIVEQPPLLAISEREDSLRLTITPMFDGAHYRTELDTANRRVYATHFTAAHRRIAEVVPGKGLVMPVRARERLQGMLDALSADISVQSDSDANHGKSIPGSPVPLLAMEPFGHSLRVRIRVEPLPDSETFFDAGTGGAVVYVQDKQGSVAVQRDLSEERTQVEAMVLNSTTLSQHYDGRSFFVIEETVDALEMLEDVQQCGVRCIWPSDIPFRIKARADIGQVNMNIKTAKEWFTTSGTVDAGGALDDPLTLARLLQLMKAQPGSRFIELGKGDFLSLSNTLKQQLDTLQAFTKPENKDSDTSKVHPMALLSLNPLLSAATIKSDKAWKDRRKQIDNALQTDAEIPTTLEAELRSYQREGFVWLDKLGKVGAGACLADDMGLGKTVQTLALFLSRAELGPALVVAPTSVVGNWLQEAQRFAPSLNVLSYADTQSVRQDLLADLGPYDLLITSYGLMANDIEHLQTIAWNTVVLDEAQAIKNANTQRAKCARKLPADFKVVLTGTPVQNNLMDLHSLYSFLNPQLLGSESQFRKRFALPISRDNDEQAKSHVQQLVSPFLLRRHKRDVLKELPARTELTLNVKLSKDEAALYDLIRQEALDSIEKSNKRSSKDKKPNVAQQKIIILSYLTKLRRLCCNPSLVTPDWSGPMSKLDVFSDTLSELIDSGHKALVFSQFVDHLKIMEKHLQEKNISYQYLDGSTSARQRTERVAAFQAGEGSVFLISLTAGGTGLNLTAADYVIHLDPWWNPAVEDQASDRAHRMGQQRPVTIVRMVTSGTIEEQIQELHGTKRDLADSVLSGADSPKLDIDTMVRLLKG